MVHAIPPITGPTLSANEPTASPAPFYLHFQNITRRFSVRTPYGTDTLTALDHVSLGARPREIIAVVGPSGCGKSTLLSLGAGLDAPSEGSVRIGDVEVHGPHPDVAFMLQKDLLLPWRTIIENVTFGTEIRGVPAKLRRERAQALLARFGLAGFADRYPRQLSGGMRQRAALARTMALDPAILLMDEPFSALDAQTKLTLQGELARTVRAANVTAVIITHDLTEAVVLADRIYVMSARPGRIVREIKVDLADCTDPVERYFSKDTQDYVKDMWSTLASFH